MKLLLADQKEDQDIVPMNRILSSIFPSLSKPGREDKSPVRLLNSLLLHFRPRAVDERTLRFTLTWGLGGMAATLVVLLFCTGILLKFAYEPSPLRAYESITYLQQNILFGQLIRNIHHWSGTILLLVVFLHFLRVFFTGAFTAPRQFNWIIGLGLLCSVLISAFTGYLLPWDQLGFWAVTICTSMLEYIPLVGNWLKEALQGGPEMGPAILTSFYAIHTAVMPVVLVFLMGFHFWRVRRAKGLVVLRSPAEAPGTRGVSVASIPNLLVREVAVGLALLAFVLLFSMLFNAPLADKANPGLSPNPTKAPWYFMGLQELLMHFHPLFSLIIIPLLGGFFLLAVPYLDYHDDTSGVWFSSNNGRKTALAAALISALITIVFIIANEFLVDLGTLLPWLPAAVSNGLIPFALCLLVLGLFSGFLRNKYSPSKNELVQAVFVFLLTAFVVLTITGIWFRGTGMKLVLGS
jgi:quinol-cytochrome oxidoreductase complex cytochrome b subunit